MSEKNRDVIRPHAADGIQEFDNPMPGWWLILFIGTIVFSLGYLTYFHIMQNWSSATELSETLRKNKETLSNKNLESQAPVNETAQAASLRSDELLVPGKIVYETNCMPCHGMHGEGGVGPNLTDKYWIHGGSDDDIIRIISDGVVEKGMLAWKPMIGEKKVRQAAAYVIKLQGTNPANAKEPQGEVYEP